MADNIIVKMPPDGWDRVLGEVGYWKWLATDYRKRKKKVTQAQVAVQRFWELVKIEEEHWMWQGEVNEYGKPVFHNKNKIACHALRWAWQHICDYSIEFSMIPIANCGKELCVNPDHASVHVRKTKAQRRIEHEMGARQNAECGCVDIIVGCGDSTGV